MPTQDEQTPQQFQTTQPAQGERPAESQPIRENWQTLAKVLDGATIEDGHLHDYRTTPVHEGLSARNMLRNGSFEKANGAGASLFDDWFAAGTGVAVAATAVAGEFTHRTQAAKLTNGAGSSAELRQSVGDVHEPVTSLLGWLLGKTIVFVAQVRTNTASRVRLEISDDDGVTTETAQSSQHSGGDTFETLVVAKTIQPDATDLIFRLAVTAGAQISAIIDEARVYVIGTDPNAAGPNDNPPALEYSEWDFIPPPLDDADPATKKYVDDQAGGGGIDEIWVPAESSNTSPFGTIGTVGTITMGNWRSRGLACDDGAQEGFAAWLPIPGSWQSATVRAFLLMFHRSATATGNIRHRLDVGPRAINEAFGAQNDAGSPRLENTLAVDGGGAGNADDVIQRFDLGTFNIGASDVALLLESSRLGADAADTFGATIYQGAIVLVKE